MKKISYIISLLIMVILVIASGLYYSSPEQKLLRELNEENQKNGPFEIQEEFTGPNNNNEMYIDNPIERENLR